MTKASKHHDSKVGATVVRDFRTLSAHITMHSDPTSKVTGMPKGRKSVGSTNTYADSNHVIKVCREVCNRDDSNDGGTSTLRTEFEGRARSGRDAISS